MYQHRIQRGNLYRPMNITDDDAWDLITKLLQVDPRKRLGANCMPDKEKLEVTRPEPGNLGDIKAHPFFTRGKEVEDGLNATTCGGELRMDIGNLHLQPALNVPSLRDLCIRACVELVSIMDFVSTCDLETIAGAARSDPFRLILNSLVFLHVPRNLSLLRNRYT